MHVVKGLNDICGANPWMQSEVCSGLQATGIPSGPSLCLSFLSEKMCKYDRTQLPLAQKKKERRERLRGEKRSQGRWGEGLIQIRCFHWRLDCPLWTESPAWPHALHRIPPVSNRPQKEICRHPTVPLPTFSHPLVSTISISYTHHTQNISHRASILVGKCKQISSHISNIETKAQRSCNLFSDKDSMLGTQIPNCIYWVRNYPLIGLTF